MAAALPNEPDAPLDPLVFAGIAGEDDEGAKPRLGEVLLEASKNGDGPVGEVFAVNGSDVEDTLPRRHRTTSS